MLENSDHRSTGRASALNVFGLLALLLYGWAFLFGAPWLSPDIQGLFPYWFDPKWTTDDAVQQLYPFHKVHNPDLFRGDIVTAMMESYLPPIHYWLSYGITLLTADPIMTGHWVMLIQLSLSIVFLFLLIRRATGFFPACMAVIWFLHTRHVIQRLTAGLPRGWAAPLFLAYLYFLLSGRHGAVLATILVSCLLQPVAGFLIAGSYTFFLLWQLREEGSRAAIRPHLIRFVLAVPIYAVVTLSVVGMPPEIGHMVSYAEALTIPEFQRPGGRFPFVPLYPILDEIRLYGFHAFEIRYVNPGEFWRATLPYFVALVAVVLFFVGKRHSRNVFPAEVVTFGIAAIVVYFLSRWFAFHLYVPDRHLRFPLAIFFIVLFTIGAWRAGVSQAHQRSIRVREVWGGLLAILLIGALIVANSGSGLRGSANFNYSEGKYGNYVVWLRKFAPRDAIIAGHPTHMDPTQLFGMRQVYMSTEAAHPFYSEYAKIARQRVERSFRAHYARDLRELLELIEPEGITHFVFARRRFYPEALAAEQYKEPHTNLVRELASRPWQEYAFRQLPRQVDVSRYPFMVYRDEESAVIDVGELRRFLSANPDFEGANPS